MSEYTFHYSHTGTCYSDTLYSAHRTVVKLSLNVRLLSPNNAAYLLLTQWQAAYCLHFESLIIIALFTNIRSRLIWKALRPLWSTEMTRNSSGDEIANVNFLYDDIVHALQNTTDSCINSAMHRSTRLEHRPLRRSRSFKVTDFGTNRKLMGLYDFLLVINTNLHPILRRFQVMADY